MLKELSKALYSVGVSQGQSVCVFSDLMAFGIPAEAKAEIHAKGTQELLNLYCETLQDAVGDHGALLMPAFTYSACRGELFDPGTTPSTVGTLTEYFRSRPGVARSLHPVFSMAGWGKKSKALLTVDSWDCFGSGSFFDKMIEANGAYLLMGTNLENSATFVYHALQAQRVPYRYFKHFKGKIQTDFEKQISVQVPYYVRDLDKRYRDSWGAVEKEAIAQGVITVKHYSGGTLMYTRARKIDGFLQEQLLEQPLCMIEMEL